MKFSIIIPVYNVEKYLEKCIESILLQTFPDYEMILVDDGSTDLSRKICDLYAKKYSNIVVIHQENQGLSGARNTGIQNASGDYILFIDSDDYLLNNDCLEEIAKKAVTCDIVVFDWVEEYEQSNQKQVSRLNYGNAHFKDMLSKYDCGTEYLEDALVNMPLYPWYICIYAIKKDFWINWGFSFVKGVQYEDLELAYRVLVSAKNIEVVKRQIYVYRINRKGSIASTFSMHSGINILDHVQSNILDVVSNERISNELKKRLCNNFSSNYYFVISSYSCLERKERKVLFEKLKKSRWVCDYTYSGKKQKVCKIIVSIFGISLASFVIGWVQNVRHKLRNGL